MKTGAQDEPPEEGKSEGWFHRKGAMLAAVNGGHECARQVRRGEGLEQRHKGEEQPSPLVHKQKAGQCVLKSPGMASCESGDRDLVALNAESSSLGFSWRQKQSLKNFKQK